MEVGQLFFSDLSVEFCRKCGGIYIRVLFILKIDYREIYDCRKTLLAQLTHYQADNKD